VKTGVPTRRPFAPRMAGAEHTRYSERLLSFPGGEDVIQANVAIVATVVPSARSVWGSSPKLRAQLGERMGERMGEQMGEQLGGGVPTHG
jgi:hypothetical protein